MNYERAMENFASVIQFIRQAEDYIDALQTGVPEHERNRTLPGMALIQLRDARNMLDTIRDDLKK